MTHIPYIDLHCHLDGSITLDIARKLAELLMMRSLSLSFRCLRAARA